MDLQGIGNGIRPGPPDTANIKTKIVNKQKAAKELSVNWSINQLISDQAATKNVLISRDVYCIYSK